MKAAFVIKFNTGALIINKSDNRRLKARLYCYVKLERLQVKTGTLVLLYETGALSAGVITGDYRSIYSTTKDLG